MLLSEQLRSARVVVARGWCRGALENGGSVCAMGALNHAAHGHARYSDCAGSDVTAAAALLARVMTGRAPNAYLWDGCFDPVVDWNNHPERTQQDVLDAFDAAIAIAEQQERALPTASPVAVLAR